MATASSAQIKALFIMENSFAIDRQAPAATNIAAVQNGELDTAIITSMASGFAEVRDRFISSPAERLV
ncbi:MAG TPA: hypothetical protein VL240_05460 [Candidatus Binatia bacterium]|nr:hypothetical protein [Candidatus Binatia bacterium]